MRKGAFALLGGILLLQQLSVLPDQHWALLLPVVVVCLLIPAGGSLIRTALRLLLIAATGFLWALCHAVLILNTGLAADLEGHDVMIIGRIRGLPEIHSHHARFQLAVEQLTAAGKARPAPALIRLNWYGHTPRLNSGDRWRLKVRLKRPHGLMNPGGFDYESWLFRHHLRATGYVRHAKVNRLLDPAREDACWLDCRRQALRDRLAAVLRDSPFQGMITALAVGDHQAIGPRQWETLTRTGTSHLVAISGLHIGLVAGLCFWLMRRLWSLSAGLSLRWAAPKAAALMAMLGAALYAAMAGFSIPTQRALIMVVVMMGALLQQQPRRRSDTLALALVFVLLFDPLAVMAPGFWLSFAAVGLIFYVMTQRLRQPGGWRQWGRVHLVIAVGLIPLMLLFFQQLPLISPLANMLAVPWMSFLVVPPVLLAAGLLTLLPTLAHFFLMLAGWSLALLWPLLEWLASFEAGQWHQHLPAPWTIVPAVAGILLLLAPRGIPARWLGIIGLLPVFLIPPPRPPAGGLWFSLLDVGQGLSAVVQTHDHVLVYDTGPRLSARYDTGAAVLVPFFRYQGINRIDMLMLGHGDNDHIGGAHSLQQRLVIDRLVSSVPERIPWRQGEFCRRGQHWRWDGIEFDVLHPTADQPSSGNNSSCVLRVRYPGGAILLTGDIEKPAERALVQRDGGHLVAQVLVAPHHGSNTSSSRTFLAAVQPEYVLFPVGYLNRFGFPKAVVKARYRALGTHQLDTAQCGAIRFSVDARGHLSPPLCFRKAQHHYWQAEIHK